MGTVYGHGKLLLHFVHEFLHFVHTFTQDDIYVIQSRWWDNIVFLRPKSFGKMIKNHKEIHI